MNDTRLPEERLHGLLADRALFGSDDESSRLLQDADDRSVRDLAVEYELIAAALDPALRAAESPALPPHVASAIRASAPAPDSRPHSVEVERNVEDQPVVARLRPLPWLLAAASLLLAVSTLVVNRSPLPETPDWRTERTALLAGGGSSMASWQALDDSSVLAWSDGDVVWDDESQTGFMRFNGLAQNDPSVEQYQLWIFDSARSEAHPVDGGVFDIAGDGEVVVKIDPKLRVFEATAFAITVEAPGGVVVSDRSRLALLAPVSGT